MKHGLPILLLSVTLWVPSWPFISEEEKGRRDLDSLIVVGLELGMKQAYEEAVEHFRCLALRYPESPAPPLFQAGILQTRSLDLRIEEDRTQFDSLITSGLSLANSLLASAPNLPEAHYYRGVALGLDAYARLQRGEHFAGYFKARAAVASFERAVELNPDFADAAVGLGTYYYWKSRKLAFLTWLPFFSDDREKGIALLERGVDGSVQQKFTALSNLMWIYLDRERNDEVVDICTRLLNEYPMNRLFLRGLGTAYFRLRRYAEAAEVFERLLISIQDGSAQNDFNEVACRMELAQLRLALHERGESRKHLETVLSKEKAPFPSFLTEGVAEQFSLARRLYRQLRNTKQTGE